MYLDYFLVSKHALQTCYPPAVTNHQCSYTYLLELGLGTSHLRGRTNHYCLCL